MVIGYFTKYKDYTGSIEYDLEDKLHYGKLMYIKDLVCYHADNIVDLEKYFHEAVDDYIDFKKEIMGEKYESD
jgi:predicted HicB family RNase H-like nuclease